jgi:hypothetical protein
MNRQQVFDRLSEEREYQNDRWGGPIHDREHNIGDWVIYMEHYLQKAKTSLTTGSTEDALSELRKVTALGVACFEQFECPKRKPSQTHS